MELREEGVNGVGIDVGGHGDCLHWRGGGGEGVRGGGRENCRKAGERNREREGGGQRRYLQISV